MMVTVCFKYSNNNKKKKKEKLKAYMKQECHKATCTETG